MCKQSEYIGLNQKNRSVIYGTNFEYQSTLCIYSVWHLSCITSTTSRKNVMVSRRLQWNDVNDVR